MLLCGGLLMLMRTGMRADSRVPVQCYKVCVRLTQFTQITCCLVRRLVASVPAMLFYDARAVRRAP